MITNYTRPQLTIKQELDRTPTLDAGRINAVVIGPEYLLNRYGRETIPASAFVNLDGTYTLKYFGANGQEANLSSSEYVLDADSLRVVLENGVAEIASLTGGILYLSDINDPSLVRSHTGNFAGTGKIAALGTRDVKVGDYLRVEHTGGRVRDRRIVELLGEMSAASVGDVSASETNALIHVGDLVVVNSQTVSTGVVADSTISSELPDSATPTTMRTVDNKLGISFEVECVLGGIIGAARFSVKNAVTGALLASNIQSYVGMEGEPFWGLQVGTVEYGPVAVVWAKGGAHVAGDVFVISFYESGALEVTASDFILSGTYAGSVSTTFAIHVTAKDATMEIFDVGGLYGRTVVGKSALMAGPVAIGSSGLSVELDPDIADSLVLYDGNTFYFQATAAAASTTQFDRIRVDGVAVDLAEVGSTAEAFVGSIIHKGTLDITSSADAIGNTVTIAAPAVTIDGVVAAIQDEGTLYFGYRALAIPPANENPTLVYEAGDFGGVVDMDNDLGFALARAIEGAQGKAVYALRVGADDVAAYTTALKKISRTDKFYALMPLSERQDVQELVKAHVTTMSGETVKNFRRCYIGVDSPGEYRAGGVGNTGTVASYAGEVKLLTLADDGDDAVLLGLQPGDKVKWTLTGTESTVAQVVGPKEILLEDALLAALVVPTPLELWRADTTDSQADFVKAVADMFSNRRVALVWQESGTRLVDGAFVPVGNRFVAAEIAGLRSAALPQRPLTRTELSTIQQAPSMYLRYSQEELDSIASHGVMIVTQDSSDGPVYIRHQLTTETEDGSLAYEDSIGVNFDNISFRIKDAVDPFIGRYNGNEATLNRIKNAVRSILDSATQTDLVNRDVGPELVGYEGLNVYLHPVLKDQFIVEAILEFALPLNRGTVKLRATWNQ
jgi:hypothetical protein